MTNGEKLKEIFPKANIKMPTIFETKVKVIIDLDCEVKFPIEWWDAEYKEPTTKNLCDTCGNIINCMMQSGIVRTECSMYRSPKNDLGVDCIDRPELLKAMDTWDKFGNDTNEGLIPLRTPALQDRYVPYVKYDDMVKCVKGMSSVALIRPKGHWITKRHVYGVTYCSECDFELKIDDTNYCPKCGADMREVKE